MQIRPDDVESGCITSGGDESCGPFLLQTLPMDEIIVAKADRSMIAVAAVLAAFVLSIDVVFGS